MTASSNASPTGTRAKSNRTRLIAGGVLCVLVCGGLLLRHLRTRELPVLLVYDGYGTESRFVVYGRILEEQEAREGAPARSKWGNLRDFWRLLETDEVSKAKVHVSALGGHYEAVADEGGYFKVQGACTGTCPYTGLTPVHVTIQQPIVWKGAAGDGVVHAIADEPGIGIISDFDDTVVQSHVTDPVRMVEVAALTNAAQLEPVPGAPEEFRGARDAGVRIFVYLSGSPVNFYPRIREFMDRVGLPRGPLLLKDFNRDPWFAQENYKPRRIAAVFDALPKLKFVLVGDSGERDPEIYRAIARAHPDRVAGIVIRTTQGGSNDPSRFEGMTAIPDYASSPGAVAGLVRRASPPAGTGSP